MTSINDLPIEILSMILEQTSPNCLLVSKWWRAAFIRTEFYFRLGIIYETLIKENIVDNRYIKLVNRHTREDKFSLDRILTDILPKTYGYKAHSCIGEFSLTITSMGQKIISISRRYGHKYRIWIHMEGRMDKSNNRNYLCEDLKKFNFELIFDWYRGIIKDVMFAITEIYG